MYVPNEMSHSVRMKEDIFELRKYSKYVTLGTRPVRFHVCMIQKEFNVLVRTSATDTVQNQSICYGTWYTKKNLLSNKNCSLLV